jgi:hypothetical protein
MPRGGFPISEQSFQLVRFALSWWKRTVSGNRVNGILRHRGYWSVRVGDLASLGVWSGVYNAGQTARNVGSKVRCPMRRMNLVRSQEKGGAG